MPHHIAYISIQLYYLSCDTIVDFCVSKQMFVYIKVK